jgi:tRNA (guanine26-N2/guanine27-N2)-dimethyltransferase
VDLGFPTRRITEGRVDLLVPDIERRAGPGTRSRLPFYNPAMAVGRDVSVLLARRLLPRGGTVLDGLAAAGALGLRVAVEAGGGFAVTLNDKNPSAVALIRENIGRNGVGNAAAVLGDLNAHLAGNRYDLVEVDPFGSPVPFLDAALLSARRGTALAVTATDTAVLCGAKPEAALRRYLAHVRRTDAYAEVGTRVLVAYIARMAARLDKTIEPVLAYSAEHFVKVHVRVAEGAARADRTLAQTGWVAFDPTTGEHRTAPSPAARTDLGPLWLGDLGDPSVLSVLAPTSEMGHRTARLLGLVREEVGLPPFYADNNAMARRAGVSPPPPDAVIARLREAGFRATRTHFRENAVKTDAPWADLMAVYRATGR